MTGRRFIPLLANLHQVRFLDEPDPPKRKILGAWGQRPQLVFDHSILFAAVCDFPGSGASGLLSSRRLRLGRSCRQVVMESAMWGASLPATDGNFP